VRTPLTLGGPREQRCPRRKRSRTPPAGADDASLQAAMAFSAEAAQLPALNQAAQEELARAGAALIQIARMYSDTDAVASDLIGANPLSSYRLAGV